LPPWCRKFSKAVAKDVVLTSRTSTVKKSSSGESQLEVPVSVYDSQDTFGIESPAYVLDVRCVSECINLLMLDSRFHRMQKKSFQPPRTYFASSIRSPHMKALKCHRACAPGWGLMGAREMYCTYLCRLHLRKRECGYRRSTRMVLFLGPTTNLVGG